MKDAWKTWTKRIGATALALVVVLALVPFGTKKATAATYSREDNSAICITTSGELLADYDSNTDQHYVFDTDILCGFYSSVSFDNVDVNITEKVITFTNLTCDTELSYAKEGWTILFNGTCRLGALVVEEGSFTLDVTEGSSLTCGRCFLPDNVTYDIVDGVEYTPEDYAFADFSESREITFTRGESYAPGLTDATEPEVKEMVSLQNTIDELSVSVLSEADREALNQGGNAQVWLTVGQAPSGDIALVEEKVAEIEEQEGTEVAVEGVMDLSLFKRVNGVESQVTETSSPIAIGMQMNANMMTAVQAGRTVRVLRIHNGKVSMISIECDPAIKLARVATDGFSTYAIISYVPKTATTEATTTAATTAATATSPKTGDTEAPVVAMVLMVIALAGAVVLKKITK